MPITLTMEDNDQNQDQSYLSLELELLQYLQTAEIWTGIDISFLTQLDPYGDAEFTANQISHMKTQLQQFMSNLQSEYKQNSLSHELDPPEVVGLETDAEGEPLGKDGTLQFLRSLLTLLDSAQQKGTKVLALGD